MAEPDRPETVGDWLKAGAAKLLAAGLETDHSLDSRLLLAEAAGLPPMELSLNRRSVLSDDAGERFARLLDRRIAGEPVFRIIGRRGFYEHEFDLSPETLEPRPDTETIVEMALEVLSARAAAGQGCCFADIGTGTGAIAISVLSALGEARAIASDIAPGALLTACTNASRIGVADRLMLVRTDFLAGIGGPLDCVISNPPYIRYADIDGLAAEVRLHDPMAALDGGEDGLDAYRALAADAARVLRDDGSVLLEIGQGQEHDVEMLFAAAGFSLAEARSDLTGIPRGLHFTRLR
ncbi:MAG: peptide chain release factor N(5)-glutamine methyltransferase [Pseudomonadota bacterium]|nr:peptide chain release factor N(5)-glutamine methyltransferase [Pseudomonadota bacterium]